MVVVATSAATRKKNTGNTRAMAAIRSAYCSSVTRLRAVSYTHLGSIPGAMIGGIAIGLCECFVSAIGLSAWKDAVTFAILIIVLLNILQIADIHLSSG